jgi:hypothetical protein
VLDYTDFIEQERRQAEKFAFTASRVELLLNCPDIYSNIPAMTFTVHLSIKNLLSIVIGGCVVGLAIVPLMSSRVIFRGFAGSCAFMDWGLLALWRSSIAQRAFAAFRAIFLRLAAGNFSARTLPAT